MVDKRKIKKQHPKCGREFSPAGYVIHEKYCTGPGYKSTHTHSVPGRHDALANRSKAVKNKSLVLCGKGCGRELTPQGKITHENHCSGPGYIPGYSAQRRLERRIGSPKLKVKSLEEHYTTYTAPINDVKMAYEMFKHDSALFSAICHILACKVNDITLDQIYHLTQARDMLSLKIESLME